MNLEVQIDISILNFQHLTLPCSSIYEEAVLGWFFEGAPERRRTLICNRLCFGPFFVSQLIKVSALEG